jgi:hypothetical protein
MNKDVAQRMERSVLDYDAERLRQVMNITVRVCDDKIRELQCNELLNESLNIEVMFENDFESLSDSNNTLQMNIILLPKYNEHVRRELEIVKSSIHNADYKTCMLRVHNVKGSSKNVGANTLVNKCNDCQKAYNASYSSELDFPNDLRILKDTSLFINVTSPEEADFPNLFY